MARSRSGRSARAASLKRTQFKKTRAAVYSTRQDAPYSKRHRTDRAVLHTFARANGELVRKSLVFDKNTGEVLRTMTTPVVVRGGSAARRKTPYATRFVALENSQVKVDTLASKVCRAYKNTRRAMVLLSGGGFGTTKGKTLAARSNC